MKTLFNTTATAEEIALAGLMAAAEYDDGTGSPFDIQVVKLNLVKRIDLKNKIVLNKM